MQRPNPTPAPPRAGASAPVGTIASLLLMLACGGDDRGIHSVMGPDRSLTEVATAVGELATFAGPATLLRETGRPETIPVSLGDFSRFQPPFVLHVEKVGDDSVNPLEGFILLDGSPFVGPQDFPIGSSGLQVEVPLEPTSTLEIQLLAPVGAEVTAWVDAAVQPPPTIEITSPTRAAMLEQGVYGVSPLQITGQACHPTYPITSLVINGQAVPVDGSQLCEAFNVTQQSSWGTSVITGLVENARGRMGTLVQSYLRSPTYLPAALDSDPNATVANGLVGQLNQGVLSELASVLASQVGPTIPGGGVFWSDCFFPFTGRARQAGDSHLNGLAVGLEAESGHLDVTVSSGISANLALDYAFQFSDCSYDFTLTGSAAVDDVTTTIRFGYDAGAKEIVVQDAHVTTSGFMFDMDWGFLEDVLNGLTNLIVSAFSDELESSAESALRSWLPTAVNQVFDGISLGGTLSLAGSSVAVDSELDDVRSYDGYVQIGLGTQGYPATPPSAPPSSLRGPISATTGVPTFSPSDYDVGIALKDDVVNQILWSAWQAGAFDIADLEAFAGVDVDGLSSVSVRPHLPPVLMTGTAGATVDIGWGDLEISAILDPLVFGLPGATMGPVALTAFGSGRGNLTLGFSQTGQTFAVTAAISSVQVQLEAADALLDEAAVVEALSSLLDAELQTLNTIIGVAMPIPSIEWLGEQWVFDNAAVGRTSGATTLTGDISASPSAP